MIPTNEMELVVLFAQRAESAGFEIIRAQVAFPDAIVRQGEAEYRVEFEYKASNFWAHRHNPIDCDLVICWINDDQYPVLPILALSEPGWAEQEIALPPEHERLTGYWRARALEAESRLAEMIESHTEKTPQDVPDSESPKEADRLFVTLVQTEKTSRSQASLLAYGKPYAGTSHVLRCQRLLEQSTPSVE